MKAILSTKRLKLNQKGLLLNAGFSYVEFSAIKIIPIPVEVPNIVENAIFTSQNAVSNVVNSAIEIKNCFCVGEKTKALLEKNGIKVQKSAEYGSELAEYIVENHKNESFYFFCGNIRKDDIPTTLKNSEIELKEIVVYKTELNLQKFDRKFDGILFFSPSAVQSFMKGNRIENNEIPSIQNVPLFCIGKTTMEEAKKYSDNVIMSNSTTVESVIAKAAKYLK